VVCEPQGEGLGHVRQALAGVLWLVEPAQAVNRQEKDAVGCRDLKVSFD
jgi:hypothetical protein